MPKITYIEHNNKSHTIEVPNGLSVMEGAVQNTVIGIATTSLNLLNNTVVNVGSLSTTTTTLQGSYAIGIRSDKLILSQGIGTATATGVVTFMSVSGDLEKVKENM